MYPVLRTGDVIDQQEVTTGGVQAGDILIYTAATGRQIIHRVIRLHPLQTRGDNCFRDDPPVPAASPLSRAAAVRRGGGVIPLTSGAAGLREFHRHQLLNRLRRRLRKLLAPLAELNVFRLPFAKLTPAVFRDKTFYYAGKRPVGWRDAAGWHRLPGARFRVQDPPDAEHRHDGNR